MNATLCFFATFFLTVSAEVFWPRPESLVGFWPLSNFHKLRDISGNGLDGTLASGSIWPSTTGPFGDPQTSITNYSPSSGNTYLFKINHSKLAMSQYDYWTVSFFVKQGVYMSNEWDTFKTYNLFQWKSSLQINLDFYGGYFSPMGWRIFVAGNSLGNNGKQARLWSQFAWNYIALVFKREKTAQGNITCSVSAYSRFGQMTMWTQYPSVCDALKEFSGNLSVGTGERIDARYAQQMSCLMFYKTALTEAEIWQNYDTCRQALNAAPCGSPRLPLPSIPDKNPTAVRQGQFPWLAAIFEASSRKFRCVGTILTSYFVLAPFSCLNTTEKLKVYTGINDLNITNQGANYYISYVYAPDQFYSEFDDIGLAEISSSYPMSFESPYEYEVCLPEYEHNQATDHYVVGWGENGRSPVESASALRYSYGDIGDQSKCSESWSASSKTFENQMCFIGKPDNKVPCGLRDFGAPLAVVDHSENRTIQTGLFMERNSDCSNTDSRIPRFTLIDPYLPWIKSKLACLVYQADKSFPRHCPI